MRGDQDIAAICERDLISTPCDHNAQLVISDVQGHPRIRIGVDAAGTPAITMLNSDGQEVYRAVK
jgi:hypothetical protein